MGNNLFKKTGIILGSILLAGALLTLAAPTLLSTQWGQKTLTSLTNQRIPGKIAFSDLELSWFGKQKIHNLALQDEKKETILSAKQLETDTTLIDLLFFKKLDGSTLINDFNAHIVQNGLGATNIEKALGIHSETTEAVQNPISISLKNVNGNVQLEPLTVHLTGKTTQNNLEGQFEIDAALKGITVAQLKTLTSAQLLKDGELEVKANIVNLPVALLDQILSTMDHKYIGLVKNALGEKLDLNVNQTIANGELAFQINATSPNLNADFLGTLDKGKFALEKPGSLTLKVTPSLFSQLTDLGRIKGLIHLREPTTLKMDVTSLSIPLEKDSWSQAGLVAKINLPETLLRTIPPLGDLTVSSAVASIDSPATSKNLTFAMSGTATQKGKPVAIQAFASFEKPDTMNELVASLRQNSKINVSINGVPLMLMEQVFGIGNTLTTALGNTAKVEMALIPNKSHADVTAHIESDRLILSDVHFTLDDNLKLLKTATLRYHLPADQANEWLLKGQATQFQADLPLDIKISKINLPTKDWNPSNISIEAEILVPAIRLDGDPKIGPITVNNLKTIVHGKTLADLQYFAVGEISTPSPYLKAILGTNTNLHIDGNIQINDDYKPHSIEARGNLQSDKAIAKFSAEILDLNRLMITSPSTLNYTLTNDALYALNMASENTKLTGPTSIQFMLDISKKPLVFDGIKGLNLIGQLTIDNMTLANQSGVQNLTIPWYVDGNANMFRMDFNGLSTYGSNPSGKLLGSIAIANWVQDNKIALDNLQFNAKASINQLPLSILETLSGNKQLVNLFGPTIDLEMNAAYPQGNIDVSMRGEQVEANAALKMGDVITLKNKQNPPTIWYTMTPNGFIALRQLLGVDTEKDGIVLYETSPLKITVGSLSIPRDLNFNKSEFSASLALDTFKIKEQQTQQMLAFENLHAHLSTPQSSNQVNFNLTGTQSFAAKNEFLLQGNLENLFTADGALNKKDMTLNLNSKLATFPAGLVCSIFCTESSLRPKIEAIFGETVDADMRVQLKKMNGPIAGKLGGKHGHIEIDGQINNGNLSLNKPFMAQVALTPELGKNVLQEYIPLLSGLIGSDNPMILKIEPKGFTFPIAHFDLKNINIGQATLSLGRVRFTKEGDLGQVMTLLNNPSNEDISVWFTPLYVRMGKGALTLERMDMLLLNTYPLATWGTIDLAQDKVNILIGLSGQALGRAFHVKDLEPDYMMQIPFRGTLKDASIDKRAATAKISALVASRRGPQGQVVGALLDIAGGALLDEKVPEPTTKPLPWNYDSKQVSTDNQISESERPKPESKNPLKEEAKKMFKNVFK